MLRIVVCPLRFRRDAEGLSARQRHLVTLCFNVAIPLCATERSEAVRGIHAEPVGEVITRFRVLRCLALDTENVSAKHGLIEQCCLQNQLTHSDLQSTQEYLKAFLHWRDTSFLLEKFCNCWSRTSDTHCKKCAAHQ